MSDPSTDDVALERRIAAIPRVDAVASPAPSGVLGNWRGSLSGRHAVAAVAAFALLWWLYSSAAGRPLANATLLISVTAAAALGALLLASYVPPRAGASGATGGGACAAAPLLILVFAGILFGDAVAIPFAGVAAAGLVALGLARRVVPSPGCATCWSTPQVAEARRQR